MGRFFEISKIITMWNRRQTVNLVSAGGTRRAELLPFFRSSLLLLLCFSPLSYYFSLLAPSVFLVRSSSFFTSNLLCVFYMLNLAYYHFCSDCKLYFQNFDFEHFIFDLGQRINCKSYVEISILMFNFQICHLTL